MLRAARIHVDGRVQGVGMRPWAARNAARLGLQGFVRNAQDGVELWLEGDAGAIDGWLHALRAEPPPGARIERVVVRDAAPAGAACFRIDPSETEIRLREIAVPRVPPDMAVCDECLADLFREGDRRYRYPFTHCASCGPRASVLLDLPYDRERTTLRDFPLCLECRAEYADPHDRRFHAETIACPACGPSLRALDLRDGTGIPAALAGDPIERAVATLRDAGIVALKGYGGYHLLCDAMSEVAVARLRERKRRPAKPFAVLVPDRAAAERLADIDPASGEWLAGPARAVVVGRARRDALAASGIARSVAPRGGELGLILPSAPAHWLLLFAPGSGPARDAPRLGPLVMTSANDSDEPTLADDTEALRELAGVADLILTHDRAVARPCDDAVVRAAAPHPIVVRLSRGVTPLRLSLPESLRDAPPVLALGADLKCSPALAAGGEILLAEHAGDLRSATALDRLDASAGELCRLARVTPLLVACDLHPDTAARITADRLKLPVARVQHHHAHALACLIEHGELGPALALVLDGAGYGADGTVWGGELLRATATEYERLAHLEIVPLLGGDAAAREPWRAALAWLDRAYEDAIPRLPELPELDSREAVTLRALARRGYAFPRTSSCGRLFDAVAAILGLGARATYEGELASALEATAAADDGRTSSRTLPPAGTAAVDALQPDESPRVIAIAPLVRELAERRLAGAPVRELARAFHFELARRLTDAVLDAARRTGLRRVALTGGCMQNRLLASGLSESLRAAGLDPLTPRQLPPNDGAIAVGQAVHAAAIALAADAPREVPCHRV